MNRIAFGCMMLMASDVFSEVVLSGWVPNTYLPQGQVQWIRTSEGSPVVQVLLHTRFLDRVVRSITGKEKSNWPEHHPDARQYLAGLEDARQAVHQRSGGRGREVLVICFDLTTPTGAVRWLTGSITETNGHWSLHEEVPLGSFVPSRQYLVQNAALILEDSLGLSREELGKRLEREWAEEDKQILNRGHGDG